tara:strand:- start:3070 stop:3510 length:441 start_codon:yes stop_codon:yes gene_type:complete
MPYNNLYLKELKKLKPKKLSNLELAEAKKIELALVDDAQKSVRIADKEIENLKAKRDVFEDVVKEYNDAFAQISEFIKESQVDIDAANDLADLMIEQNLEFGISADAIGLDVSKIPLSNELEEKSTELINLIADLEGDIDIADRLI